ncbi:MAG TPA: tRNA 2-selenouridine(34) synthase MnmH [Bacteroidales bacterium]|nr:tRNA 2-selenouridine(34) synthase MnmH [Bacteroidales bacterium]
MADYKLNIIEFLEKYRTMPVIDVRSPAEFEHGHIPGAINLPLFNNEERSIVGTLYLQKGSTEAMMRALELIGPKMKEYADLAMNIAPAREAILHCWRGGMRSDSMAWLLNTIGIKTYTLEGGYKSYRKHVQTCFAKPLRVIVIGGMTGAGKTKVLEALESLGKQVIHLEELARHKGSVFGSIGMSSQPTTEQFENDLFTRINQINTDELVYVEDESVAIGNVFIPQPFFRQMASAPYLNLVVPTDRRIQHLADDYANGDKEFLVACIKRIEKRLGLANAAQVIAHINNGEMNKAVEMVLHYYDKVYTRSMGLHKKNEVTDVYVNNDNYTETAQRLISLTCNR